MLHQISQSLFQPIFKKKLTPQLLHPQPAQSPLQVAQLAQEQGAIVIRVVG